MYCSIDSHHSSDECAYDNTKLEHDRHPVQPRDLRKRESGNNVVDMIP